MSGSSRPVSSSCHWSTRTQLSVPFVSSSSLQFLCFPPLVPWCLRPLQQAHTALSRPVSHHSPASTPVLQSAQTSQHSYQGLYFLHLAQPILPSHNYLFSWLTTIPAPKVSTVGTLIKDPLDVVNPLSTPSLY